MPFYEYKCTSGHIWEERHSVDERYPSNCPKCGEVGTIVIYPVPTTVMFDRIRRKDKAERGAKGEEECAEKMEKEQAQIKPRKQTRKFKKMAKDIRFAPKPKRGNR